MRKNGRKKGTWDSLKLCHMAFWSILDPAKCFISHPSFLLVVSGDLMGDEGSLLQIVVSKE